MSDAERIRLRIELAQGHARLGEWEEAAACLARAVEEAGAAPPGELVAALEGLLEDPEVPEGVRARLRRAESALARAAAAAVDGGALDVPLATTTVAELLARQGAPDRALAVVEAVLRRAPGDRRAAELRAKLRRRLRRREALRTLERWLARAEALARARAAEGGRA